MLAFMLCRTEIHGWMYVFLFPFFLQAFGHRSFTQGLPTRAGLERVGKKPPHLPIVLSPETPPKITHVSENRCRLLHSKHQPASFAAGSVLLPAREFIVQQQFRSLLTARSDDHPTILITQLKPASFFRASGVQTKKNASFPKNQPNP